MKNKILFRGFYPTESGLEQINISAQVITGRWIYWNEYGQICKKNGDLLCNDFGHVIQIQRNDIIEDTVSQLVFIDTRKRFFFFGDILLERDTGCTFELVQNGKALNTGVKFLSSPNDRDKEYLGRVYDVLGPSRFEIIGNKWVNKNV